MHNIFKYRSDIFLFHVLVNYYAYFSKNVLTEKQNEMYLVIVYHAQAPCIDICNADNNSLPSCTICFYRVFSLSLSLCLSLLVAFSLLCYTVIK